MLLLHDERPFLKPDLLLVIGKYLFSCDEHIVSKHRRSFTSVNFKLMHFIYMSVESILRLSTV